MIHVEIDWFHPEFVNCRRIDCLLPAYGQFNTHNITQGQSHAEPHHLQWLPPLATRVCKEHLGYTGRASKICGTSRNLPETHNKTGEELRFGGSCEMENYKWQGCVCKRNTYAKHTSNPVLVVNQVADDHYDLCFYESLMDEFSDVTHV